VSETSSVGAVGTCLASLPPPPRDWEVPFRRLATEIGLGVDLANGHELAARLLDPILSGDVKAGR